MAIAPWMTEAIYIDIPDTSVAGWQKVELWLKQGGRTIVIPDERIERQGQHTLVCRLTEADSAALRSDTVLKWQVAAVDADGNKIWSPVYAATVDEILKCGGIGNAES